MEDYSRDVSFWEATPLIEPANRKLIRFRRVLEFGVEMRRVCAIACVFAAWGFAEDNRSLPDRARQYTLDLIRLDTSNPPGNEPRVAEYLKEVADAQGIPCELIGADPKRMNFVARLHGAGKNRPLLLMAHSA